MIPDSFPLKKNTLWDFPGGSGIISPRGEYIAGPVYDHEDIVYAEIDTNLILRAKVAIDSTGHFSRPDILELKIHENEASQLSQNKLDKLEESITALEAKIKSLTELLEN
jgi:hypothetical protein